MKKTLYAAFTVLAVGLPVQLEAYPITVNNPSFELPITATTAFPPADWTVFNGNPNDGGVWNIVDYAPEYWPFTSPPGNPPDGKQIGYLSLGPEDRIVASGLSQVLTGNVLAANTTYTLRGYVGHPLGFDTATIYTASLYAGGNLLGSVSGNGPEADFAPFILSVNSALFPLLVGQTLEVRLESSKAQTGFDVISLQAPDGGLTVLLLGMGLTGLGWMRRKKA